ncbi:hypothetical protein [Methylobacterium radiotolerans]|uniref:hypothetical protein n=1 Tax=Methylobacterium radiotolerans TaxID=31998 RepID=UPI001F392550|nr:hypothetical protein [Methylobacterium radiotolerans]UIY44112.1 hypothetical protein LZ599_10675 [Methylobacterium radiotolerans]
MTIKLLSVEETLAAAALACGRANRPPFDPRRALDGLSATAIISLVVLAGQLDAIAKASARTEDTWRRANDGEASAQEAADAAVDLIRLLSDAGYLPLSPAPATEEAAHAQG